jgi:hypothetical protein
MVLTACEYHVSMSALRHRDVLLGRRLMPASGGKRASMDRLGKDPSPRQSRHTIASAEYASPLISYVLLCNLALGTVIPPSMSVAHLAAGTLKAARSQSVNLLSIIPR